MHSFRLSIIFVLHLLLAINVHAQFAAAAGQEGTTAIFADSSIFIDWASEVEIERGPMNIAAPALGQADFGVVSNALGKADNLVVSLGDGGSAIFHFNNPVINGDGFDFAVFENSFNDDFLELCFVEVSSDGVNFYRFNASSLSQTDTQIDGFGVINPTEINNLGGKYRALYGTPFELEELSGISGLNINNIRYIRLVDVVGCINTQFASFDSHGNMVNDPWPTPFPSSGFDIDAVGIIHNTLSINENSQTENLLILYPNPSNGIVTIEYKEHINSANIISPDGRLVFTINFNQNSNQTKFTIDLNCLNTGLYILKLSSDRKIINKQIVIH